MWACMWRSLLMALFQRFWRWLTVISRAWLLMVDGPSSLGEAVMLWAGSIDHRELIYYTVSKSTTFHPPRSGPRRHSSDTMLLAPWPCWASGAEPPMVVRVVTGIARTGSVRSGGAERVMKEAFAHCRGPGETRGQVATTKASHTRDGLVTPHSGREQSTTQDDEWRNR
jgi:hypothetical protein